MWGRIGVNVELQPMLSTIMYESIFEKELECYEMAWFDPTRDGYRCSTMLFGTEGGGAGWGVWNGGEYSNPAVDELFLATNKATDLERRKRLLESAESLLIDDIAYIPTVSESTPYGVRKGLEIEATADFQVYGRRIHFVEE
jgi:ABC-type transport system substrate-binding protein